MTKRWPIALGCLVVAAVALYFTFFRESDENAIKRVLAQFATIVSVKDGDTIISRTARMRSKMQDVVTDGVSAHVAELNVDVRGREKLEEDAIKVGLVYASADCTFVTKKIEIDPAATFAKVDATALVTANRGGERKVDKREVHFLLRKDGGWKIDSIDVAPVSAD
ncbi:MAG: hypothetical protein KIT84_43520 [Labilithrix sp.]|nr:hypothetical protein [Labilithrix sp.]MCW5817949.1 hypothetical protein [Labilithrix sp.]